MAFVLCLLRDRSIRVMRRSDRRPTVRRYRTLQEAIMRLGGRDDSAWGTDGRYEGRRCQGRDHHSLSALELPGGAPRPGRCARQESTVRRVRHGVSGSGTEAITSGGAGRSYACVRRTIAGEVVPTGPAAGAQIVLACLANPDRRDSKCRTLLGMSRKRPFDMPYVAGRTVNS